MDSFEQLNKLFSNDDHNTIIKSQICTFDCRNSTTVAISEEEVKTTSLPFLVSVKQLNGGSVGNKSRIIPVLEHKPKGQENHLKKGGANHQRQGNHQKKKMSDWGDEDTTEVVGGRGFGTDNGIYKTNNDDYGGGDYQYDDNGAGAGDGVYNTEENDNGYGNKKRYNGEGRRRGRGGGRGGGGRYNRDFNGNEVNDGEQNVHVISDEPQPSKSNYKFNFAFALTPKDFREETIKVFQQNLKDLFNKATLVQKYSLLKYLMDAYEQILLKTSNLESDSNKKTKKPPTSRSTKKIQQQLQKFLKDDAIATSRTSNEQQKEYEAESEITITTLRAASISSTTTSVLDVLNVYQQDLSKHLDGSNFWLMENSANNSLELISHMPLAGDAILPAHQSTPPVNISDLFRDDEFNSTIHNVPVVSFLKYNKSNQLQQQLQQQQEKLKTETCDNKSKQMSRRRSERLQEKELQNVATCQRQPSRLQHDFRSPKPCSAPIPYFAETPPLTPTPVAKTRRRPPYISEEEYSLRFRLTRRQFLKICEMPFVKYNIETSTFSYFPMDLTLNEEEYLCESPRANYNGNMQQLTTPLPPLPFTSNIHSSVTMTTSGDQYSSLNVIRQVPSVIKNLSSFGSKQLMQPIAFDEEAESKHLNKTVNQDMSPLLENNYEDMGAVNLSSNSITAIGEIFQAPPQPQEDCARQIPLESIAAMEPFKMPQISSSFTPDNSTKPGFMQQQPSLTSDIFDSVDGCKPPVTTIDLPSVEEGNVFRRTLKMRASDTSTPLGIGTAAIGGVAAASAFFKPRKTRLMEMVEKEISNMSDSSESNIIRPQEQQQTEVVGAAVPVVLQPIVEVGEDVIRPSVLNVDNSVVASENASGSARGGEDYRKDWYEILRTRLQNFDYENCYTTPKRKRKHRRPQKRRIIPIENQNAEAVQQQEAADGVATSDLLQQTLAGILPPVPHAPEVFHQTLNSSTESCFNVAADVLSHTDLISLQQQYDQFILKNANNITTIVDNLPTWRRMLTTYRRGLQRKVNTISVGDIQQQQQQQPCQYINPEVLLNASSQRLEIKLHLIQNIIRQVSFDFTKCNVVTKDRMSAAIGFAFLLELKAAGIISLSSDGRNIALR